MNFFGMGPMEIIVIMVVALVIFGPGRLPEIGATVGKAIREFRAATEDLTGEFQRTMDEVQGAADEVRQSAMEVQDVTRQVVRLDQMPSSASAPAHRIAVESHVTPQSAPSAVPSKADPLADLMFGEPAPVRPEPPAPTTYTFPEPPVSSESFEPVTSEPAEAAAAETSVATDGQELQREVS
jgi:TatA/E family protein of Tat protein translocase